MKPREFGKKGEELAARYLEEKGYVILESNFRKRAGEIDLIAFDPIRDETVFVEVKSRRNRSFGAPEESISRRKLDKMAATAETWMQERDNRGPEWRLDLVGIEQLKNGDVQICHIENLG